MGPEAIDLDTYLFAGGAICCQKELSAEESQPRDRSRKSGFGAEKGRESETKQERMLSSWSPLLACCQSFA